MSQDEAEIRQHFLEEAQEYLNTIESVLLQISTSCSDRQMDAALRAAHSVKGGAGMMGFQTLSQLAHRFEEFFKILRARRQSLTLDSDLEGLLLSGLDSLSQVVEMARQGTPTVAEDWLTVHADPIFEQLHQRLGDVNEDDVALLDMPEEGQDLVAQLFDTEVAGSLDRLELILATPEMPCLLEEVQIVAQELSGLGEMLELRAFTDLCDSIADQLTAMPDRTEALARAAVQVWRRSQALVTIGQVDMLPTQLDLPEDWTDSLLGNESLSQVSLSEPDLGIFNIPEDTSVFLEQMEDTEDEAIATDDYVFDEFAALEDLLGDVTYGNTALDAVEPLAESPDSTAAALTTRSEVTAAAAVPEVVSNGVSDEMTLPQPSLPASIFSTPLPIKPAKATQPPNHQVSQAKPTPPPTVVGESRDQTVRVSVQQLDQLNDLFGELTIERNGLSLHLGRLRNLVGILSYRMRSLEQSNIRLRTAYDQVATQVVAASFSGFAPVSSSRQHPSDPNGSSSPVFSPFSPEDVKGSSKFDILEMDQYGEQHLLSQEVMETIVQVQEVTSDIDLSLEDADQTARDLNRTAKQLQTSLTQVRMRPLSDIVGRFPRALRDLSREYGKVVELKVYGGATLIDRAILETLSDPMMHLFRNCFDHGIETPEMRQAAGKPEQGTIEIRAAYRGNRTIITMGDDGGGINIEKIRAKAQSIGMDPNALATATERELLELIFEPGFSTASQVTALSGRGVGMDVVRTNLKQVRGDIRVDTKLGVGSTFTISVPFTLSVVRVLLVESNGMLLAFPKDVIEEMLLPEAGQIFTTAGNEFLNWDGFMVPLIHLNRWLSFNCPSRSPEVEDSPIISAPTVLMISQGNELTGIRIDRCWGEQEVAVRQVEGSIPMPIGFAGCTILGNGRVVPLVDTATLLSWIMDTGTAPTVSRLTQSGLSTASAEGEEDIPMMVPAIAQPQQDTILVVDDSINVRRFLKLTLQKAGYRVEEAKDGQDALEKLLGGLQVEAVICDIEMPRLDGYGFLARIKAEPTFKDLPVAMLTSRSGNKHRQLAMSLGATAYFSKPYKEQDLLKTLEQLIQPKSLMPTF